MMLGRITAGAQSFIKSGLLSAYEGSACRQFRTVRFAYRTNYTMDKVYLRNDSDSSDVHISFRYASEEFKVDRDFNFCRKINEKIEDALNRIRGNIEKELNKKSKKNRKKTSIQGDETVPENLIDKGFTIEFRRSSCKLEDITFAEMLAEETHNLKLKVLDHTFDVAVNLPWVSNLVLPASVLAGFNVYPSKVEMKYADKRFCKAVWYKAIMPNSGNIQNATWERCGEGFSYSSTNADVGCFLKFVLTPGNSKGEYGPAIEAVCKNEIQAGPGPCPFESRHLLTGKRLQGDDFRMVSYNILADLYADSDYTRTHLFPYCPAYALKVEYRKQLYIKEILGYNADILCLQEVDMKIFDFDLKPILEEDTQGFRGIIAQKGECGEGLATFYRADRFELLETISLNIGESVNKLEVFKTLWEKIKVNEKLSDRLCCRSTTLQLSIFKERNDRYLIVANTHLYFHPDADHIRLLQAGLAMLYIEDVYRKTLDKYEIENEKQLSLTFCGDFNSVPECGIYRLVTSGYVDKNCVDWRSNEEQIVENVCLSQPFELESACGTPAYTNFTHAFAACLDYIFFQCDRLEVTQFIPLPSKEELVGHVAIPSVVFPSDHVPLIADLRFKPMDYTSRKILTNK